MDTWLARYIVPAESELNAYDIVIENATKRSGLARHWSRFFRHAGYRILRISASNQSLVTSLLMVSEEVANNELALNHLKRQFPDLPITVMNVEQYRSDMVLMLGEDLVDKLDGSY